MTFALNLIAAGNLIVAGGSEVEWSRTLMMAWLIIALTLSIIEVYLLTGGSSQKTALPHSEHA